MEFQIATDIGGTCTDSVVMDETGSVSVGKALTTYPDFSEGIFDSLADAVDEETSLEELLSEASFFFHATTVGENTIFERDGSETGLLTTEGFEETLHTMRGGYGRWSGLSQEEVKHQVQTEKPEPLIPQDHIVGVGERTYRSDVLKEPDEERLREVLDTFADEGVESVACAFLWSFATPENEQLVRDLVAEEYPELYVTASHEVSPSLGEYERTSTSVINSYLGPTAEQYLESLQDRLFEFGFDGTTLLMFSHGGLVTAEEAIDKPIGLIESGPVAGVLGSQYVGSLVDERNVLSTDMGGTTFKTGVVRGDRIEYADEPMVGRYHYQFPKRDVHSIPVAGGSIVWLEDDTNIPHIGPQSAGSSPGPICYGQGGEEPTLTDVCLLLGYMAPEFFLGGDQTLETERPRELFEETIAEPLGRSVPEAAMDIFELANSVIADFLREHTVEKGIDPREFSLSAIGGASGMFATSYARNLGVPEVIVPATASVHSAFGQLTSDVSHEDRAVLSEPMTHPLDRQRITELFDGMVGEMRDRLRAEGFDEDAITIERSLGLRYRNQVHDILTPIRTDGQLTQADLDATLEQFEQRYRERYGEGSTFEKEAIELKECRIRGTGALSRPQLSPVAETDSTVPEAARVRTKPMYFVDSDGTVETQIYDFEQLPPGTEIAGPAVVATPVTTVVLNPGDDARIDPYKNVVVSVGGV
jgi:N-methylhydantoinase A